ncbi:hypothetical protein ZIOFF_028052 [Zingiber officinale]|uniref:CCHC-type domain-containing protein n=1 Tax=Zingiber officinale TaxID=94328 RepID=A0A8J5L8R1_ZINOF|nr:hypothetical protein ZIOFF_028052 [Zingiber officinale]
MEATGSKSVFDAFKLDRFDGTNFTRWKDKLFFLLTELGVAYLLLHDLPLISAPTDKDTDEIKATRKKREEDEVRLKDLKIEVSDPLQVAIVIAKLPTTWNGYRKKLLHTSEDFTIDQLIKHIRIEEETRIRENKFAYESGSKVNNIESKKTKYSGKKRKLAETSPETFANKKKTKNCYFCGKKGHYKNECRFFKRLEVEGNVGQKTVSVFERPPSPDIIAMIVDLKIDMITECNMATSEKSADWWQASGWKELAMAFSSSSTCSRAFYHESSSLNAARSGSFEIKGMRIQSNTNPSPLGLSSSIPKSLFVSPFMAPGRSLFHQMREWSFFSALDHGNGAGGDDGRRTSGGGGGEEGDADDSEEKEFGPIMKFDEVIRETEARGVSLPPDMLEAAKLTGIRRVLLFRYFELEAAWWPLGASIRSCSLLRYRMLADTSFLFKVATEVIIDSCCATFAEVQKRGKDFWAEFELYAADLLVGIVVDIALVGLLAPYVRIGRSSAAAVGFWGNLMRASEALPSSLPPLTTGSVFEAERPGCKFTIRQRIGTYFYKGAYPHSINKINTYAHFTCSLQGVLYGSVGFVCGIIGQGNLYNDS